MASSPLASKASGTLRRSTPRSRPDPLLTGRKDPVRVEGVLDRLVEPPERVAAEVELVGHQVHEPEVGPVQAVPGLRGRANEHRVEVEGRPYPQLVTGVE